MVVHQLSLVALSCAAIALAFYTWKILNWVWFKPKKLEKSLRQLGFKGTSYRFFYGDFKDVSRMVREAKAKPMGLCNDIGPRVFPIIDEVIKKYGDNGFLWFGPRPVVIVKDPELIREIMSKHYEFQKPSGSAFSRFLAAGLAAYETDKWAKHRRLINPAFHLEKLKLMVPSFYLSCDEMLSKWDAIVPSEGSCELDVWPYVQTLTSDAISRTAFGSNYKEGQKIFELQKNQAEYVMEGNRSVYVPGSRFLPTKLNRKMKKIAEEVESSLLGIIRRRLKAMEAGEATSNDVLGLLLESNIDEIKKHGNKFGMSLKDVIEECKLFYFTGQETTACLLAWTMLLLAKHKDWQVRAREEVLQVFGKGKPEYQELTRLKIVTMILNEVLRLYPPGPVIHRITIKESKLGRVTLPAGVQLTMPVLSLHHDPKQWGKDAKEFNPERFSEGVSKATQSKVNFIPFGWGPRICIGQSFAMLEAKLAMAMILQRYSFDLSPSYAHAPYALITLQPQFGAHFVLKKI